jgi:hypothetical protein
VVTVTTPLAETDMPTATAVTTSTAIPNSVRDPWRQQQVERQDFAEAKAYITTSPTPLYWYDPTTGQSLEIGRLFGEFVAVAQFQLKARDNAPALEVPYQINQDYGLTAISPVLIERMKSAGQTNAVVAYVLLDNTITPKE